MERLVGGDGQIQNINEVYATIKRVASRFSISDDRATVLLVRYQWDEETMESHFKLSPGNGLLSDYFFTNPIFEEAMTECHICCRYADCQGLGCGHFICEKCFKDDIEAKVLGGELELFCPNHNCWKFLSHYRIKCLMSVEALNKYELSLLQNFQNAKQALEPPTAKPPTEEDSLIKKVGSQIVEMGKDLASAIGESKKEILLVGALHASSKVFKKGN